MSASYLIDRERGIVFSRGWGELTDGQIRAHAAALSADPRFSHDLRQVVDFRDLKKLSVSSAGVRHAARNNPFRPDARRAFVIPTDEVLGVLRMFEIYSNADPKQFRIFRDLGPALEWAGLDPATPWPAEEPDATFDES